jgi:outer membrane protein TolC
MKRLSRLFAAVKLVFVSVEKKRRCVLAVGAISLVLGINTSRASEQIQSEVLPLQMAVEIAMRDNPNVAEMQARYAALSDIPSQVGALPDPVINLNAMNLPTDTMDRSQESMTQLQIGFSQEIPFPGKLGLKEAAAEFDAQAAGHSVDEVRLQLTKNVKSTWWQLYYLDRALETVAINKALLRQLIAVATTKYETGGGLQQDVLLSQLELSKLMDQEIQLQAIRRNQSIQLNVLMGRSPSHELILQRRVSTELPELISEDEMYLKAEFMRPLLRQMEVEVDAAKSRLDLAKRDYYPDFKLGMTYGDRTGDNAMPSGGARSDFVSVMVGVKVPLYAGRKQSKAVSQKNAELQKNRYALIDKKNAVMGAISSAATDYHRAKQQFLLFGTGIVPQAQQTVESMLSGYQVSEVDFLNLVRSQITLFNYQLQYWKALSDARQALARLESAVGEESIYE